MREKDLNNITRERDGHGVAYSHSGTSEHSSNELLESMGFNIGRNQKHHSKKEKKQTQNNTHTQNNTILCRYIVSA